MKQLIITAILALVLVSAIVAVALWPNQGAENQVVASPEAVSSVIQDLAPGDTFHMVTVIYRRHGLTQEYPSCEVEWKRNEVWASFDDRGEMVSYRGEARAEDGTLCGTTELEDEDLVSRDANGNENHREKKFIRSGRTTVQATKNELSRKAALIADSVAAQPSALTVALGSEQVLMLEEHEPFVQSAVEDTLSITDGQKTGYSLPYVADLNPVERIKREYILPDVNFLVKSETVFVAEDGTEIVTESMQFQVFEVLEAP